MKTCFKCDAEKPLGEFYTHPEMADGHLNKCKECAKKDARKNGQKEHVKARDRERNKLPHRKADRYKHQKMHRKEANARNAVYEAVKSGKLKKPNTCEECNKKCDPDGHHDDYEKRLDVRWLCRSCHAHHHVGEK